MVVADAHRVRVAERVAGDFADGPRPDPDDRRRGGVGVGDGELAIASSRSADGADPPERLGAAALEPERMERVVRHERELPRRRLEAQPERARCRLTVRPDERAVDPARLVTGDLLLEDRRE